MRVTRRTAVAALVAATLRPAAAAGDPPGFELPLLDGSRFVRLDELAAATVLLNFWSSDCPPCVREMPLLDRWAAAHAGVAVVGIAVDAPDAAQRFAALHPVRYLQLRVGVDARVLLRRFGNREGVLPYTVLLGPQRQPCASRRGELEAAWLDAALRDCG